MKELGIYSCNILILHMKQYIIWRQTLINNAYYKLRATLRNQQQGQQNVYIKKEIRWNPKRKGLLAQMKAEKRGKKRK